MKGCVHQKKVFLSLATPVVFSTLLTFYVVVHHQQSSIEVQAYDLGEDPVGNRRIMRIPINSNKTLDIKSQTLDRKTLNTTTKDVANGSRCKQWFEPTFKENLNVVSKYPRGNVQDFMLKIGSNMTQPKYMMTKFPVLVTAASSGHFMVSQGLLKSIHQRLIPKYGDIKIIYYDLGLTDDQVQKLNEHCKCEVRKFQFSDFPKHVSALQTYTWKPIIVKTLLMEYGWVWYMDSSARFTTDDLDRPLEYSLNNSVLFFTYGASLSVAHHTDKQTSAFLGEDMCKFRNIGELEAGFVLYHFDRVTSIVVDQWVTCALVKECMAPDGAKLGCSSNNKNDGQCHRYDQAVLSIIIRRLYHDINDYPKVKTPFRIHVIRRGEGVNYF